MIRCESGEGPDTVVRGITIANGFTPDGGGGLRIVGADPTIIGRLGESRTAAVSSTLRPAK